MKYKIFQLPRRCKLERPVKRHRKKPSVQDEDDVVE